MFPPPATAGRVFHFAFEVDDCRAAVEHLKRAGVTVRGGPSLRPDGFVKVLDFGMAKLTQPFASRELKVNHRVHALVSSHELTGRTRLTGYKRPRRIEFCAELPKNPVGKVLRRQLRDADSCQPGAGQAQ